MSTLPSGAYVSAPLQTLKMVYGLAGGPRLIGQSVDDDLTLMQMDAPQALPAGSMRRHGRADELIVESVTWRGQAC